MGYWCAMTTHWPTGTKVVYSLNELADAGAAIWESHRKEWQKYRTVMRLLETRFPDQWQWVRQCRTRWEWADLTGKTNGYQIWGWACETKPFCPACNNKSQVARAMNARDTIAKTTPRGQEPRIFGVTIAPRRDPEWRETVRNDHRRYMRAVYRVLERMYGKNVGAIATYQDYGESPFIHHHPHVHATVNGWNLRDGRADKVAYYDVAREGGIDPLRQIIVEEMTRAFGTKATFDIDHFSIRIERVQTGQTAHYKWLNYQMRELIDPMKWEWERGADHIEVINYTGEPPAKVPLKTLNEGLASYGARFGRWGVRGRRTTDGAYGIMADKKVNATAEAMQSTKAHADTCRCKECVTRGRRNRAPDRYAEEPLETDSRPW